MTLKLFKNFTAIYSFDKILIEIGEFTEYHKKCYLRTNHMTGMAEPGVGAGRTPPRFWQVS